MFETIINFLVSVFLHNLIFTIVQLMHKGNKLVKRPVMLVMTNNDGLKIGAC